VGVKLTDPLETWPFSRKAQPVVVPRSRARMLPPMRNPLLSSEIYLLDQYIGYLEVCPLKNTRICNKIVFKASNEAVQRFLVSF
jgi:hypothetical protein